MVKSRGFRGPSAHSSHVFSRTLTLFVLCWCVGLNQAADCGPSQWECAARDQCVEKTAVCDGSPDCKDGSDESFTICAEKTCPGYAFQCSYGACVDGDAPCNGKADCVDSSDELLPACKGVKSAPDVNKCRESQFACLDGGCIPADELCDGVAQCRDKSDETITQCRSIDCPSYAFRCAYGACVDGDAACNKVTDCMDQSDEFAPKCNVTSVFPSLPTTPTPPLVPNEPPVPLPGGGFGCKLPPYPDHGVYSTFSCDGCNLEPGKLVAQNVDIRYDCYEGFTLRGIESQVCRRGGWTPPGRPVCSDVCEQLLPKRLELVCFTFDNKPISCKKPMPARSFARFHCREGVYIKFREPNYDRITCRNGRWNKVLPEDICQPACGRAVQSFAQPVVVNGVIAEYGRFTWHAGIYEYHNETKMFRLICGGSLISHNVVVTAAHCLTEDKKDRTLSFKEKGIIRVALGKHIRQLDAVAEQYRQIFEVKSVLVSPDYTGAQSSYADDIAMLVLKTSVEFSQAVLPVCLGLGTGNNEDDQLVNGAIGLVTGWGLTENGKPSDELLVANMSYIPRETCLKQSTLNAFITHDKICGGDPSTKTTVCRGDSGGGYVFQDRNTRQYYLRGIVSLGERNCVGDDYALFTKVSKHAAFINNAIDTNS